MQKLNTYTDQQLIVAYKQTSDQGYLAELFKRYQHLVYGSCLNYLTNEEKSRDALMELYEHLKDTLLKHEVTHFKSWLFRVTYNHCMQILRKEQRLSQKWENYALEVDRLNDSWLDDDVNDVQESMLTHLEDCIEELKEHQKKCVDLFYLKDKCYQEIADLTGHALKKVKSYIQNGKRNLKNCVEFKNGQ